MALDFGRTEEHAMLTDSLRRFAASQSDFEARAHRLKGPDPQRLALWQGLADLGVTAALTPEEFGGFGGRGADMAVVMEALAGALFVEPIVSSGVVAQRILLAAGDEGAEWLAAAIAGEAVFATAFGEGFDPFESPRARAVETRDGYMIDGFKPAVRHAEVASHILVTALLDGVSRLFVVPAEALGQARTPMRLIDGAGAADVHLKATVVGPMALLSLMDAQAAVAEGLEWALVALAVETAALCVATNAATFDYLGQRRQFGAPLASFQALQHRAADMAMAAEEAAAMASLASEQIDTLVGDARSAAVLRASLACDAAGKLVGHAAVQLFGGMGVSDELVVSHYARRFTAIRNQFGSMDVRMARLSLLEGAL